MTGLRPELPVLAIGSHLDTVPNAGKYDGVLGVLLGVAAVKALGGRRLPFGIDVIAFSEEEGVRYRAPFLGSLAAAGRFDRRLLERTDAAGITMADAFRSFGLDPARIEEAAYPAGRLLGYLEVHIEQGPVLETLGVPAAVVEAIAGQSRIWAELRGRAGHAGTTAHGRPARCAGGGGRARAGGRAARPIDRRPAGDGRCAGRRARRLQCDSRDSAVEHRRSPRARSGPGGGRERDPCAGKNARRPTRRGVPRHRNKKHHAAVPADPVMSGWLEEALASSGHTPAPSGQRRRPRCRRDGRGGADGDALSPQSRAA